MSQASDNLSPTASNAQDQVASFEANLEERIKNNPLVAVGVAVGIGWVAWTLSGMLSSWTPRDLGWAPQPL